MVESIQKLNSCILCKASNFHIVHRKDHWQYLRCRNCNLVSVHPRPTSHEVTKHYEDYLPSQPKEIEQWKSMMRVIIAKSANLIESRIKTEKGSILDIGCGYGFFLQEMKFRGWEVKGIEISEVGREYARDKWVIPVHSRPLEDLALSYPGVMKTYAIQAGRELRVIVESEKVSDEKADKLAFDISQKIQKDMQYPGHIKVTVIREKRAIAYAK